MPPQACMMERLVQSGSRSSIWRYNPSLVDGFVVERVAIDSSRGFSPRAFGFARRNFAHLA